MTTPLIMEVFERSCICVSV